VVCRHGNDGDYNEMGNALHDTKSSGKSTKLNVTTFIIFVYSQLELKIMTQIQTRCRTEIHAELGRDTPATLANRQRMPYTNATINEIQRLGNILPINVLHNTTKVRKFMLRKLINYFCHTKLKRNIAFTAIHNRRICDSSSLGCDAAHRCRAQ
jgi:hypothetical protein